MTRIVFILLILTACILLYLHSGSSHGYFRAPLDKRLQLAANFGELREGHFHMGLDIRTGGREGMPVYAAADGYISHLSIREYGLGKALFITHPNGLITVYGHLQRFTDTLESLARHGQYTMQSWQQELELPPGSSPVKKGMLIAYSGNTGASQAPHLHFEVRDATTDVNINPQLEGFSVEDNTPPVINGLYWYDRRYSTYMTKARKIAIAAREGQYHTVQPIKIIRVHSPLISLGIAATDKSSSTSRVSGIFGASLWLDDSLLFVFDLRRLSSLDTRYIDACIDYAKWVRSGMYVQHLSLLPGNHASIFTPGRNGLIHLRDTQIHVVRIRVIDVQNNQTELTTRIQYAPTPPDQGYEPVLFRTTAFSSGGSFSSGTVACLPGKESIIRGASFTARFGPEAFYDRLPFHWQELPDTDTRRASSLIYLHDPTVPVHDGFPVQVKTTLSKDNPLRARTVLQLISGDSQYIIKGNWQGDWMRGFLRRLGILRLVIDTVSPALTPYQWEEGQHFSQSTAGISVQCKDDLGPVADFRGEIDGHWVPFTKKGSMYTYTFDAGCLPGKHKLVIAATDVAGNTVRREMRFVTE
ncbi:MAG: M23 family metallopeptidase [Chitinophagaceae bacterium]|nr:M23 family metallopeptidase [Chitinophagaceae bacterium]